MSLIIGFILNVIILAVALLIVSKIPAIGVEVDSTDKALMGGAIIGLFNAVGYALPLTGTLAVLSLGIIPLVVGTIIFGVAAMLVEGFRLRHGIISAFLGAICLALVGGILNKILALVFGV